VCLCIENFLTNQLVKDFWKSVHICQSYHQTSSGFLFWDTVYRRYAGKSRLKAWMWCTLLAAAKTSTHRLQFVPLNLHSTLRHDTRYSRRFDHDQLTAVKPRIHCQTGCTHGFAYTLTLCIIRATDLTVYPAGFSNVTLVTILSASTVKRYFSSR